MMRGLDRRCGGARGRARRRSRGEARRRPAGRETEPSRCVASSGKAALERAARRRDRGSSVAPSCGAIAPYVSRPHGRRCVLPDRGQGQPAQGGAGLRRGRAAHWARASCTDSAVLAIEAEPGGYRAQTAHGTIRARRVVNAAGVKRRRSRRMLGARSRSTAVPMQVSVTEPVAPLVKHLRLFAAGKLTLKQTGNGSLPDRRRLAGAAGAPTAASRSDPGVAGREPRRRRRRSCRRWPRRASSAAGRRSSTARPTGGR